MKLSIFSNRLLPAHFIENHEKFCLFVSAYIEFLSDEGSPFYTLDNLSNYTTLSESIGTFYYQLIRNEYAVDFPKSLIAETEMFLTNITHLYRAKGTEAAYKYFFRIIYNIDVTFKYPKDNILKYSDGKWVQQNLLNFEGLSTDDLKVIKGSYIKGMNTQAIGHVLDVVELNPPVKTIFEFNLSNLSGDEFFVDDSNKEFDIFRVSPELYDDTFLIFKTETNSKIYEIRNSSSFIVEVMNFDVENVEHVHIDPNTTIWIQIQPDGQVLSVPDPSLEIDPDKQYGLQIDMVQSHFQMGESASIVSGDLDIVGKMFTISDVSYTQGHWRNSDGLLNSDMLIQDNYYYQAYSYVLQTRIKPSQYYHSVKKLLHPAGLMMFTEYVLSPGDETDFIDLPEPIMLCWHHLFLRILHFVDIVCKLGLNKFTLNMKREFNFKLIYENYFRFNRLIKIKVPEPNVERKHSLELIREFKRTLKMDLGQQPLNISRKSNAWYKKQTFLWDKFDSTLDMMVTSENYDQYPVEAVEIYNFEKYSDLVLNSEGKYSETIYKGFNQPKEISTFYDYQIDSSRAYQQYTVIDDPDVTNQKILFTWDTIDGYKNLEGFIAFNELGRYLKSDFFDVTSSPGKIIYSGPTSTNIIFYYINYNVLYKNWTFVPFQMTDDNHKIWLEKEVLFFDQNGKYVPNEDLYLDKTDNYYKSRYSTTYKNVDVIVISTNDRHAVFKTSDPISYVPLKFEGRDIQPIHYYNMFTKSFDYGFIKEFASINMDYGYIIDNNVINEDFGLITEDLGV